MTDENTTTITFNSEDLKKLGDVAKEMRRSANADFNESKAYNAVVKAFGYTEANKILAETEEELKQGIGVSQGRIDNERSQTDANENYARAKATVDDFNKALRAATKGDRAVLKLRRIVLQDKKGNVLSAK